MPHSPRVLLFALVLLATPTAYAQTSPASVGRPHTCGDEYPPEAMMQGIQGTTTLQLTITAEGDVTDISVIKSSGNQLLDDASVTCVSRWKYRPAIDGTGKPVAVPWKANVVWDLKTNGVDPAVVTQMQSVVCETRGCLAASPRFSQLPKTYDKMTSLLFVRPGGAEGKPTVQVSASSGDAPLDNEAVTCFQNAPSLSKLMDAVPADSTGEKRYSFTIDWQMAILGIRHEDSQTPKEP